MERGFDYFYHFQHILRCHPLREIIKFRMELSLLFSVVAMLLPLTHAVPNHLPVCIVGAGPAGLIAAQRLEIKGRKTVIFEKQDAVGGKSQAVYNK